LQSREFRGRAGVPGCKAAILGPAAAGSLNSSAQQRKSLRAVPNLQQFDGPAKQ